MARLIQIIFAVCILILFACLIAFCAAFLTHTSKRKRTRYTRTGHAYHAPGYCEKCGRTYVSAQQITERTNERVHNRNFRGILQPN
jgi:hypothetical protein